MRAPFALAVGLAVLGWIAPAAAAEDDPFADGQAMRAAELDGHRGGTETATEINGSVLQSNDTTQNASNSGNIGIGDYSAKINGTIHEATVVGNHGITAVMQNTGDLVNMNNATSVNVFMQ